MGPATVCRGKEAFIGALSLHPAFVSSRVASLLPLAWSERLPDLTLVVDSVADGSNAVGVEWHVELGGAAIPLGRGLTHAIMCPRTGRISRVVDIAEAPWRTVGILLSPAVTVCKRVAGMGSALSRADRQSAALAFVGAWALSSALAVSAWLFGYAGMVDAEVVATGDERPSRVSELRPAPGPPLVSPLPADGPRGLWRRGHALLDDASRPGPLAPQSR